MAGGGAAAAAGSGKDFTWYVGPPTSPTSTVASGFHGGFALVSFMTRVDANTPRRPDPAGSLKLAPPPALLSATLAAIARFPPRSGRVAGNLGEL